MVRAMQVGFARVGIKSIEPTVLKIKCLYSQMCLVIGAIFGVVVYRIIMVTMFYRIEPDSTIASLATSLTASVINLLAILILSVVSKTSGTLEVTLNFGRTFPSLRRGSR